jgi:hypothetical protein
MSQIIRKYADIALFCEEWWEVTHENNLNYLDRLFKDDTVRRTVRLAIILQVINITLCYAITSEKSAALEHTKGETQYPLPVLTLLKNLLFYTHQNFLVLADVIITRLPPESA